VSTTAFTTLTLLCPACKRGACRAAAGFVCDRCGHAVPVREGFPSLTEYNEFYEHQCTNSLRMPLIDRVPLPVKAIAYIDFLFNERHRRNRFFRRAIKRLPKRRTMLDIGCGGGMEIWRELGEVTGLSNSFTGLKQASTIYSSCVHADLSEGLPFPSESFDYIAALDIVGHFDEAGRNKLLSEIRRCLTPEGRFIAVIEGLGSWFDTYTRGNPKLREAYIEAGIKRAGHIGLESPDRIRQRLRENGLTIEFEEPFGAHPGAVDGYFTPFFQDFPPRSPLDAAAKAISRVVRHSRLAARVTDNVFGAINTLSLRTSSKWHDAVMAVCKRSDQ
jgi:SAM-dependent methyltransferase